MDLYLSKGHLHINEYPISMGNGTYTHTIGHQKILNKTHVQQSEQMSKYLIFSWTCLLGWDENMYMCMCKPKDENAFILHKK